jgi:putative Mn2+ efflux pump MntP
MSKKGTHEDVVTLLYLVPFLASGIYGIYLWAVAGISAMLPSAVYLGVTRSPYVFLAGSLAVMLGAVIDVTSVDPASRQAKLKSTVSILQSIAVASLILSLLGAWYSNRFSDFAGTVSDFLIGRYSVLFPAVLVLLSYLVTIPLKVETLRNAKVLGVISLVLVPVTVYEVGKRDTVVGLAIAVVLVVLGIGLFLRSEKSAPKQPAQ